MIDYAPWEVIENGATLPKTKIMEGVITEMPITTAEEKAQKRLEVKARSTLMMGIPNEHQLKFNSIKDAKKLLEAVEKRFGRNAATRKTQRNLLKQQYENFTASSSKMLDQTFDRLQKLWNTHAVIWRNKVDLDTMSIDDIYNNLKVYEPEVKGMSSSTNTPLMLQTSTIVILDLSKVTYSLQDDMEEMDLRWQMAMLTMRARRFLKNIGMKLNVNGNKTIGFDKSKVECYNCHKMRHFARECRAPRNQDNKNKENSRRSVPMEISTSTAFVSCDGLGGYEWSDQSEEGPNYALMAFSSSNSNSEVSNDSICSKTCLETIESLKSQNDQLLKFLKKSELIVLAIRELRKKLEIAQKEKDGIQLNVDKFEHASKSLNKLIECQIVNNCKKGVGYENYNVVPPPYTENIMPPTPDLSFTGLDEFFNKLVVENYKAMSSEEEPKVVRKNDDAPIIKDWVSDDEKEDVSQPKTEKKIVRPSIIKKEFVKSKQQEKIARKNVKQVENHRQNTHSLRGNQRNWNNMMSQKLKSNFEMFNKACYVCEALIICRVNHQNFAKKTHPCAKKNMVPRAVLMKSELVSINTVRQNISKTTVLVNTARQVNVAHSKSTLNVARPMGKNVNTVRPKAVVNAVKGNNFNAVKALAGWVWKPKYKVLDHVSKHNSASIALKKGNPQMDLQDQGVIDSGCTKASDNAGQARKETKPVKDYILLPLWTADPPFSQDPKSSHDDGSKPSSDDGKKVNKDPRNESECKDQENEDNFNSTNNVNTVSTTINAAGTNEVNAVGGNMSIELLFDPKMPALEDDSIFNFSSDDEDDVVVADMNNLDTTIQEEPKKVIHALKDPSWIEAMQEELLQFKLQEVWTLVDLPNRKRAIGFKWVFRNKKDEKGIMIRNKPRLVAQGYTQEEGIDYDEFFTHVSRIEAIRLFLAYASFKDFVVYQMDVKVIFSMRILKKRCMYINHQDLKIQTFLIKYTRLKKNCMDYIKLLVLGMKPCQHICWTMGFKEGKLTRPYSSKGTKMSSMGELTFFLGLQVKEKKDGIFISQDKYVAKILKKFRSMIGSLMYLTSSRPNIMFAVCACARYQVNPKVSYLHAMKRIFRYLKGQPKLGLWYLKDSSFDLVAYTGSDYAGASWIGSLQQEICLQKLLMGPLVRELILEFLSTLRFGEVLLDFDAPGRRWSPPILLGPPPSYTLIIDPVLRLCHRMMAHSIAGKSQAPEKICMEVDHTWAWVAIGPERKPDAPAGTPILADDAPVVDEGDQAVLAPVQAPQQPPPPPPAAARTIPQRLRRLEEEVQGLCKDVRSLLGLRADISGIRWDLPREELAAAWMRRTRHRADGASQSTSQQDQHAADP
ncbi:ribonuclease H-like domain-containing protein [Tanacetum coccineum]